MKELTIIFGTSNFGKLVYESIYKTHEIMGFCDNDSTKWGTSLFGKHIFSAEELLEIVEEKKVKIIIASSFHSEIMNQLSFMGIPYVYMSSIHIKHNPILGESENEITIKGYDIKGFSESKIIDNRVGLIVRNNSGSSTLALWKNITERIKSKFEVILIYDNEDRVEYYKKVWSCKVIVTTHTNNLSFFDSDERIFIQLWHGFPMKGVGRLDKSRSKEKKVNTASWSIFDKITSYSNLFTTIFSGCFGGNINDYEITGAPRNDFLFTSNGKENLSKVINADLAQKKVVYYTPTFRLNKYQHKVNGNKKWNNFFGFEEFDLNEFSQFLLKNDIFLILKMHPYEEGYVKNILEAYETSNIALMLDESLTEFDFYETLNACDLLITDYSSIFYDYLLLDRPILFTPVDLKEYTENTGMLYGPYDFWTPGDKAYNQQELQQQLLGNLLNVDKNKKTRETITEIIHHYKDEYSCERVWNLIEDTYELNKNKEE